MTRESYKEVSVPIFDIDENLYFLDTPIIVHDSHYNKVIEYSRQEYLSLVGDEASFLDGVKSRFSFPNNSVYEAFRNYFMDSKLLEFAHRAIANNDVGPSFNVYIDHLFQGLRTYKVTAGGFTEDGLRAMDKLLIDHYFMPNDKLREIFVSNIIKNNPLIHPGGKDEEIVDQFVASLNSYGITGFEFAKKYNNGELIRDVPYGKKKAFDLVFDDISTVYDDGRTLINSGFSDDKEMNTNAFHEYADENILHADLGKRMHLTSFYTADSNKTIKQELNSKQEIISLFKSKKVA